LSPAQRYAEPFLPHGSARENRVGLFSSFVMAELMRFIPRSVMVGFVNSLTISIFTAQLPTLIELPWLVYPLVVVGILIVVMPCLTKSVRVRPVPMAGVAG